jgi:hypothetical protein
LKKWCDHYCANETFLLHLLAVNELWRLRTG